MDCRYFNRYFVVVAQAEVGPYIPMQFLNGVVIKQIYLIKLNYKLAYVSIGFHGHCGK